MFEWGEAAAAAAALFFGCGDGAGGSGALCARLCSTLENTYAADPTDPAAAVGAAILCLRRVLRVQARVCHTYRRHLLTYVTSHKKAP